MPDIRRADFPLTTQAQGMQNQASTWLLEQIDANEMSYLEALQIVSHLLQTVTRLIEWSEKPAKRRGKRHG